MMNNNKLLLFESTWQSESMDSVIQKKINVRVYYPKKNRSAYTSNVMNRLNVLNHMDNLPQD